MGKPKTALQVAAAVGLMAVISATALAQPQKAPAGAPAAAPAPPPAATPRTPDGHPDLNGYWTNAPAPGGGPAPFPTGPLPPGGDGKTFITPMTLRNGDISNLTNDGVIARRSTDNLPLYKPKYWSKVEDLDFNGNLQDPYNSCMPPSVPRIGAPHRILLTPGEVHLFYTVIFQRNDFRSIPIGPRTRPVDRDGSWMGDPVAHWEGDTLVVETVGFNDQSWIGPQGYLHGYDMKVTETFRREGDRLIYGATVEDPEYLQKPWVRDPVALVRIRDPNYRMEELPPCSDRDTKNQVGKQREM